MELLRPTSFVAAIISSENTLNRISNIIAKYCGAESAQRFLSACHEIDYKTANQILDATVKELTGYVSASLALSSFAEKFPQLAPGLQNQVYAALSESDKVKVINSYSDQILNIIGGK